MGKGNKGKGAGGAAAGVYVQPTANPNKRKHRKGGKAPGKPPGRPQPGAAAGAKGTSKHSAAGRRTKGVPPPPVPVGPKPLSSFSASSLLPGPRDGFVLQHAPAAAELKKSKVSELLEASGTGKFTSPVSAAATAALKTTASYVDAMLELIPAKYYIPMSDAEKELTWSKYYKNKAGTAPKQELKEASKKAKRQRYDLDSHKPMTQLIEERALQDDNAGRTARKAETGGKAAPPTAASSGTSVALSHEELRQRLHAKIAALRAQRHAPEGEGDGDGDSDAAAADGKAGAAAAAKESRRAIKKRERAEARTKAKAKGKAKKAAAAAAAGAGAGAGNGAGAGVGADASAANGSSALLPSMEEHLSLTTMKALTKGGRSGSKLLATADGGADVAVVATDGAASAEQPKKRRKQSLRKLLAKAEEKQTRLKELQKESGEVPDQVWDAALLKASGDKVKDDPKMLAKTIKRREKKKDKSRKAWSDRKETVKQSQEDRQRKRNENLKARTDKKLGKGKKKTKGGGRAGFEGKRKKVISA